MAPLSEKQTNFLDGDAVLWSCYWQLPEVIDRETA